MVGVECWNGPNMLFLARRGNDEGSTLRANTCPIITHQQQGEEEIDWIPACAGMTGCKIIPGLRREAQPGLAKASLPRAALG